MNHTSNVTRAVLGSSSGSEFILTLADGGAACDLLDHVNTRLAAALAEEATEVPVKGSEEGQGSDGLGRESLLGVTLCSPNRHDIKLDLRDAAVGKALNQVLDNVQPVAFIPFPAHFMPISACQLQCHMLSFNHLVMPPPPCWNFQAVAALGPTAARLLGPDAELFELGAIIADGGASRQPAHPDTPWSPRPPVCTVFIALQVRLEGMRFCMLPVSFTFVIFL